MIQYEHINDDNKQSKTYMVQYEHINDDNKQSMTYMVQYEHMITNKMTYIYNMNTQ